MKPFILLLLLAPLAHADHPLVEDATAYISDYANYVVSETKSTLPQPPRASEN